MQQENRASMTQQKERRKLVERKRHEVEESEFGNGPGVVDRQPGREVGLLWSMSRGSGRVQATVILVGQSRLEWPIAAGQPR